MTFTNVTTTFPEQQPEWVVRYPAHLSDEQVVRLRDAVTRQMEAGEKALFLPDGTYLESTRPSAFLSAPVTGTLDTAPRWVTPLLVVNALAMLGIVLAMLHIATRLPA